MRNQLLNINVYAEIDSKNETLNKRIRNAEKQRVPMIVILGEKEEKERIIAIRDRREKKQSTMGFDEFIKFSKEKMREVSF